MGSDVEASTSLRYLRRVARRQSQLLSGGRRAGLLSAGGLDGCGGFNPAYSRRTRFQGGLGHAFARPLKFLAARGRVRYRARHGQYVLSARPFAGSLRAVRPGAGPGSAVFRSGAPRRAGSVRRQSHTRVVESLDDAFMSALESADVGYFGSMPADVLVEGTSEIRNWIVVASGAGKPGKVIEYQPLYRTGNGVAAVWALPVGTREKGGEPLARSLKRGS